MATCECLETCIFFNDVMENMPVMSDRLKKRYCLDDATSCARYMVFKALGGGTVPGDLFPNHRDRAKQIIAESDIPKSDDDDDT